MPCQCDHEFRQKTLSELAKDLENEVYQLKIDNRYLRLEIKDFEVERDNLKLAIKTLKEVG